MELFAAHREWASRPADERYDSLDALATAVQDRRQASEEALVSGETLTHVRAHVDDHGQLVIGGQTPTNWSMGQMASLIKAPAGYLRDLPPDLAAKNLNYGLQHRLEERNSDFKLLAGHDDHGATLRACTSGKYSRVWDADVVHAIRAYSDGFRPPLGYKDGTFGAEMVPSGLYASDHDVFCFLVKEDDPLEVNGEALHRGFYAWNSETGGKTLGWSTFLYRAVCGNNIIWGATDIKEVRVRHVGDGPRTALYELLPQAIKALRDQRPAAKEAEVIKEAMAHVLAKDTDEAVTELRKLGFTGPEATSGVEAAKREERDPYTRWGLLQGLTAHARTLSFHDKRDDLERRAADKLLPAVV